MSAKPCHIQHKQHQTMFQPHQYGQHGCTQTCTPVAACHQQHRDQEAVDLASEEHQGPTHVTPPV